MTLFICSPEVASRLSICICDGHESRKFLFCRKTTQLIIRRTRAELLSFLIFARLAFHSKNI